MNSFIQYLIPIVLSIIISYIAGYIFKLELIIQIVISESLILAVFFMFSYKKFRSMYLIKKYGPQNGYKLLRAENSNKVYLISNNNKRWIKEPTTLYELGYDIDMVETVQREKLNSYIEKNALSIYWFSEIK